MGTGSALSNLSPDTSRYNQGTTHCSGLVQIFFRDHPPWALARHDFESSEPRWLQPQGPRKPQLVVSAVLSHFLSSLGPYTLGQTP